MCVNVCVFAPPLSVLAVCRISKVSGLRFRFRFRARVRVRVRVGLGVGLDPWFLPYLSIHTWI